MQKHLHNLIAILLVLLLVSALSGCVYSKKNSKQKKANKQVVHQNIVNSSVTLGQDDVFEVRVFKEKDLSSIYRVSSKGSINFPLIGEVGVSGKTPNQIENEIRERLEKDYLKQAYVSVFVKEFNSKKIFVFGQVRKPGTFRYEEKMSIIQAITLAGGFTNTASKNAVSLTRLVKGVETRINVKTEEIWKGEQPNILLQPGDIIFIPETLF